MQMSFDMTWILTVILLSVRVAVVIYASPLDAMGRIPSRIRLFLSLALAVLLSSTVDLSSIDLPESSLGLALMMINEAVLGLVLAFSVHCAFAVFDVAGRLIDFQAGLGAASILNPATNASEPLFGTVFILLATLVFFLTDGHHLFLEGLAFSVQKVPPGQMLGGLDMAVAMHDLGLMFSLGLVLAAPVLACLLLMEVGIAVMARTMPQMNVYFLFLPLKVAVGLLMTALSLKFLSPLFLQVFTSLFQSWDTILATGAANHG